MTKETEPMWRRIERGTDRSGGPDACWVWVGLRDRKGYGRLSRGARGAGMVAAHRAAYELALGPIPAGLFVCHRCDVRACVNPAHLFLGTAADNNRDMVAKGRHGAWTKPGSHPAGEAHPLSKLNEETVREIRALWASGGVKQRDLAARFGVDQQVIWSVIHRRTWAQVA